MSSSTLQSLMRPMPWPTDALEGQQGLKGRRALHARRGGASGTEVRAEEGKHCVGHPGRREVACAVAPARHNLKIDRHPDTAHPVAGVQIPDWEACLELAARCYELTGLGYLGVDLVMDKHKGPLMLELNARPGLNIQIANDDGLLRREDETDHTGVNIVLDRAIEVLEISVPLEVVKRVRRGREVARVDRHAAHRVAQSTVLCGCKVQSDDLGLIIRGQLAPIDGRCLA